MKPEFNTPGVRASGFKTTRQLEKLQGARDCNCGRTISANKIRCAACQTALETAFAAARTSSKTESEAV